MRRGHVAPVGGGEPLPPFSESLVFWAPLTEGDLTDHISGSVGTTPSNNTNCSVTWDDNRGLYRINNRVSGFAGLWWQGLNMFPDAVNGSTLMRDIPKTIYLKVLVVTTPNGNGYAYSVGVGAGNDGYNYNVTTGTQRAVAECLCPTKAPFNIPIGTLHAICYTRDNLTNTQYLDGTLVSTNPNDPWTQLYYTRFGTRMSAVFCPQNAGDIADMCIQDIRIYNRALTASEVAQL